MEEQEPRNEQVGAAVSATEKRSLAFVAGALDLTLSELLRTHSVNDALAKAEEIRSRLGLAA